MSLPFDAVQFFGVFVRYNDAVWPAQLFLVVLAGAASALALRPRAWSDRAIGGLLAFLWVWMGVVYHFGFFSAINPAARLFGGLFIFEGLALGTLATIQRTLRFRYWKMIVLTGPTQIAVPAPAAVTDPSYQAELAAIRTSQAQLSDAQRAAIDYWSSGGVLRWNEILRELVARADLPPAPNPDGTYPVPDPNNPFADPQYPFGNPPYAARAYSYVAVAQYEALKVAWYYKYQYNRPSPFKVDGTIRALMPNTDLPGYPSEDAVVSGVNAELLKLLFPTSVEEITRKAAEQRQAALLSGRASATDIAAGLALGQAVAAVFIARAGSDGMKAAGGSPALVKALSDSATARGQVPWTSLEVPPRPPMLPQCDLLSRMGRTEL